MKYTDNAINIMTARTYKGIGKAWITKNLSDKKSSKEIIDLLNASQKSEEPITLDSFNNKKHTIITILNKSKDHIDGVSALGDDDFPPYKGLVKNSEKPIFIFYKGNLSLLNPDNKNIAVIGLLTPDNETEIEERIIVSELVKKGAVIISGLALGCDSIAHEQTLASNGSTIAILPSPLSNILPAANQDLARKIINNNGLLISEYLTDAKSALVLRGRYQERDRLQALYSNAIVLSASYAKNDMGHDSGSRLAMGYAFSYSIPRAVIYDEKSNQSNPKYDLNRQVIQEDPNTIIINQANIQSALQKLMDAQPIINQCSQHQPDFLA